MFRFSRLRCSLSPEQQPEYYRKGEGRGPKNGNGGGVLETPPTDCRKDSRRLDPSLEAYTQRAVQLLLVLRPPPQPPYLHRCLVRQRVPRPLLITRQSPPSDCPGRRQL